jgi:hypothetical protein
MPRTPAFVALALVSVAACAAALLVPAPASAARLTATCSNGSVDAATIQSVINASAAGDEIVIDGPCSITSTIELLGGRSYRGDSPSTTLTAASGSNLAAVLASDSWLNNWAFTGLPITLRDLTVDGNASANPSAGDGVVIRSWHTLVENLTIEHSRGNGLRITGTSRNGTTLPSGQTQVNGTVRNLFVEDSGVNGIFVQDSGNAVTDWNLHDNWVSGSGAGGIRLENTAGWTVERNHVYGSTTSGISADRLFGSSISDNYVEDFGSTGNGIGVTVQADAASVISGNRIFKFNGGSGTYLAVKQVNYATTGLLSVTNNTVRGNGSGTGLSYQAGSNYLVVASTGNAVTGVTTARVVGSRVTVSAGV